MIIDDKKQLTCKAIKQFADLVSDKDEIEFYVSNILVAKTNKANLVNDVFNSKTSIQDDMICNFSTSKDTIIFDGFNFNWWRANKRRLTKFSKIFNDTAESTENTSTTKVSKVSIDEKQYCVAVAYCIDNYLSKIDFFEGSKDEIIDFINKDIYDKLIATTVDTKVVINLTFDKDEFNHIFNEGTEEEKDRYRRNLSMWYTLRELEDIGALTLK